MEPVDGAPPVDRIWIRSTAEWMGVIERRITRWMNRRTRCGSSGLRRRDARTRKSARMPEAHTLSAAARNAVGPRSGGRPRSAGTGGCGLGAGAVSPFSTR